ncbi:MAG: MlaD family protein, partial [Candidatus Methylomirabilia bacterium]
GVGGLLPNSVVRLAGVQIGRVTDVRLSERPGGKVRVTLKLGRRFADQIREDSVASIETQGLLGDKVVEISLGSPGASALKPGETIATREPVEYTQIAGQGAEILENVAALSADLRGVVETLNVKDALKDLSATLKSARRITEQVEKGSGWLHALLYEEPKALRRLNALLASTQQLLGEGQPRESAVSVLLSEESGRAARQFLQAMESLGRVGEKMDDGDSLLGALLFEPRYKSVVEDLQVVAQNFRDVSEKLKRGKGILGSLVQDEGDGPVGRAARDFAVAVTNLRTLTDRLVAGEGTIGGLLEDPTVYENLAAFLEGAERSALLRYLIRSSIRERGE